MGMFDTINLKSPLVCPACGRKEHTHQTHAFEDVMATYTIGSVVRGGVLSGIVEDRLGCSDCYKAGKKEDSPVYLVIWHSVLVGVEQDLSLAEARLTGVDRLDLIGWLDEAQCDRNRWKRRFHGLFNDVLKWHDHLESEKNPEPPPEGESEEQTQRRKSIAKFLGLSDEILATPDPLAAIIEKHTPKQDESDQDGVWGW